MKHRHQNPTDHLVQPKTPQPPDTADTSSTEVQINIRLDRKLRDEFAMACKTRATSMNGTIIRYIGIYTDAFYRGNVMHLDGNICPLQEFFGALARATGREFFLPKDKAS